MIETIIIISTGITIFIIKSLHDYLHRKNINNDLHKKIDNLMNIVDIIQSNLSQKENNIINNILTLEEKLLNDNDNENKNK